MFSFLRTISQFLSKSSKLAKKDLFLQVKIFEVQNGGGNQLLNPSMMDKETQQFDYNWNLFSFLRTISQFFVKIIKVGEKDFFIMGKIFEMQNGGGNQLLNP